MEVKYLWGQYYIFLNLLKYVKEKQINIEKIIKEGRRTLSWFFESAGESRYIRRRRGGTKSISSYESFQPDLSWSKTSEWNRKLTCRAIFTSGAYYSSDHFAVVHSDSYVHHLLVFSRYHYPGSSFRYISYDLGIAYVKIQEKFVAFLKKTDFEAVHNKSIPTIIFECIYYMLIIMLIPWIRQEFSDSTYYHTWSELFEAKFNSDTFQVIIQAFPKSNNIIKLTQIYFAMYQCFKLVKSLLTYLETLFKKFSTCLLDS